MSGFTHDSAQSEFLRRGGPLRGVLAQKYDKGELIPPEDYEHAAFPKMLHFDLGVREYERTTEAIRGKDTVNLAWTERRQVEFAPIVQDEDEEAQAETAFARAQELEITIEPDWTLRRLLTEVDIAERVAGGTVKARPVAMRGTAEERQRSEMDELRHQLAEQAAELSKQRSLTVEVEALRAKVSALEGAPEPAPAAADPPDAAPFHKPRSRAAAALAASAAAEGE